MWRKLGAWLWLATQNLADYPDTAEKMLNMTAPTLWFDDVLTSTLRADKTRIIANGQDSVTLTVTVKNLTGQPAVGIPVWWRSDNGHFTDAQIETDENGEAHATLFSQQAGTASVTAIIDDQEVISPGCSALATSFADREKSVRLYMEQ